TAGALTGSGTTWSIAISGVSEGTVSIAVAAPTGYSISGSPQTVNVYAAATSTTGGGGGSSTGSATIVSDQNASQRNDSQRNDSQGNDTIFVSNVQLDKTNATLSAGEILQLIAAITPENATDMGLNWSSSDPSVASVDANGRVTAHKEGTTTITVTTDDGSFTASCLMTITGVAGDDGSSIPGFAVLTALLGLLCAVMLFKWRQLRGKQQ
ncbi:MAG: Ig-like domain-containing protein, partial [Methanimicrococcus sp.]|nr:Ig-like domain-containing protein [Methanimicrococcus sp.]